MIEQGVVVVACILYILQHLREVGVAVCLNSIFFSVLWKRGSKLWSLPSNFTQGIRDNNKEMVGIESMLMVLERSDRWGQKNGYSEER